MNDIMKIVQDLENSGILLKGVKKTIKSETKPLGASLLGDLLTKNLSGKGTIRNYKNYQEGPLRAGEGIKKSSNSTTSLNKF